MEHFGTVKSFDEANGAGLIEPEDGGKDIGFEKKFISWKRNQPPPVGLRICYDVAARNNRTRAVNLRAAKALTEPSGRAGLRSRSKAD